MTPIIPIYRPSYQHSCRATKRKIGAGICLITNIISFVGRYVYYFRTVQFGYTATIGITGDLLIDIFNCQVHVLVLEDELVFFFQQWYIRLDANRELRVTAPSVKSNLKFLNFYYSPSRTIRDHVQSYPTS